TSIPSGKSRSDAVRITVMNVEACCHYAAIVTVNDVTLIVAPDEKATELKFRLQPLVPTDPSMIAVVPLDWNSLNQEAVPVAFAELSSVMALAVADPPEAAANAVAFMVNSARST
ncbi:MAG TPA: hypothetical protein VF905_09440, partial [Nitrospirota bacterium]